MSNNPLLSFNPHNPDGSDIAPGLNRYGITFPLGSGMGLTITIPWIVTALIGVGGFYLYKAIK